MDVMHSYPLDDVAEHSFDGACQCAFTVQEVIWDDQPVEGDVMTTGRVQTCCNQCEHRTGHHTQTEAFAACQTHQIMTDHEDQLVATPANGWTRYKASSYPLTAKLGVADV